MVSNSLLYLQNKRFYCRKTVLENFGILTPGDPNFDLSEKMTEMISKWFFASFRTLPFVFLYGDQEPRSWGGRSNAPPPAGGGKSRGPAGRGLMCKSKVEGALPPHLKSWVGMCPHCPHGSYATVCYDWKAYLTSVKEYQNILPVPNTQKSKRSGAGKSNLFSRQIIPIVYKKNSCFQSPLIMLYHISELCRIWFNWGAEKRYRKVDCFTPISYRYVCMYVCTLYIHPYRQTECDQGPRQLRLCGALYMMRLCLGAGSFSAVPVKSDPLSRRRIHHEGHCLRRSSDLVGRREGDIWAGTGERGGGVPGDVVSEVTTDWWLTAVFNVHTPLVVRERTRGSRPLSKEFRLRGQVRSLADHIYIICYRGVCLRSEIKKYFFHAISLNNFLT